MGPLPERFGRRSMGDSPSQARERAAMKPEQQPSNTSTRKTPRREFLASSGRAAAGSAIAALAAGRVHAAEDNTIRLALIGCGPPGHGPGGKAPPGPDGGPI